MVVVAGRQDGSRQRLRRWRSSTSWKALVGVREDGARRRPGRRRAGGGSCSPAPAWLRVSAGVRDGGTGRLGLAGQGGNGECACVG
jgi:hypothetical protein